MRFTLAVVFAGVAAVANAHFQLAYPPPRGVFDEDNEVNFCDSYTNAVDNRTTFPLSNGFFTFNSEHPSWTLGVLISTVQNPVSFDNFTANDTSSGADQFARNFASGTGEGTFCIPLDLSSIGVSGVQDGANVTIQIVFDGGDGNLFQCADLTLESNSTTPSSVTCSNATSSSSDDNSTSSSSSASSLRIGSTTFASSWAAYAGALGAVAGLAMSVL
ncbi:uncharacterized protein STEHIDRAFT_164981 [Stereum hirsutum FP-91666 SS1]|uniref:uncharacterized protein n=1 Tax=Stereum hirsutum (strain FP-91666) TaxID=721885 RepID=UPI000440FD2B|nr:uncharacterized protein STEHIDRAFT_164981 [Stereum hirsutum FP-91666 SS1]EIM92751.1 hypothetical protein STEHIDRAFT_164981 [Stereum hirsutum FP-91666 SS1]